MPSMLLNCVRCNKNIACGSAAHTGKLVHDETVIEQAFVPVAHSVGHDSCAIPVDKKCAASQRCATSAAPQCHSL
jgi:hypothetical protein